MRNNRITTKNRIRLEGRNGEKISGVVQSFDKKALKIRTARGMIVIIPWEFVGKYWRPKKI